MCRCCAAQHCLTHSLTQCVLSAAPQPDWAIVSWPRVGLGGFAQWATHTVPQTWTARPIRAAAMVVKPHVQQMRFPTLSRNIIFFHGSSRKRHFLFLCSLAMSWTSKLPIWAAEHLTAADSSPHTGSIGKEANHYHHRHTSAA